MSERDLLNSEFASKHPDAFAKVLGRGDPGEIAVILESLPPATAASIASRLPASRIKTLLASDDHSKARWLADAPLDDAKTLLSRIPRENSLALINSIPSRIRRRKLLQYLNYPAHSLGALVTDVAIRFSSEMSAADVLAELRSIDTGNPGLIAIVRPDGRYLGTLDLWALLVSDDPVGPIRKFSVRTPTMHPETSLITAAQDRYWHSNNWLPVVDHENHLLGAVSRSSILLATVQPEARARSNSKLFTLLVTDVMRLFGRVLDAMIVRRSKS
ncbi:MAG: CBS domain-containing protein [Gammaproteobacteria bacterium]|nr:CBS domain-containing protein [Gammaproteobacteria bacterium]